MSILYDSDDNKDLHQDDYFEDYAPDQEDLIKEVFDQYHKNFLDAKLESINTPEDKRSKAVFEMDKENGHPNVPFRSEQFQKPASKIVKDPDPSIFPVNFFLQDRQWSRKYVSETKSGFTGYYRCPKPQECSAVLHLKVNGDSISTTVRCEHTCLPEKSMKKRKVSVVVEDMGEVMDITAQMKQMVEDLALEKVGLTSKAIANKVLSDFDRDFKGIACKRLTVQQMMHVVVNTRRRNFADTEGLIRAYPLNSCPGEDTRMFLQFFCEISIANKQEKIVGWAHPDLIFECLAGNLNMFIDCTFSCCPKGYEQCMNIMIYSHGHDKYVNVFNVLMTGKTTALYNHALMQVIASCDFKMNAETVTCDFESALLNSVKLQFPEADVVGCLFHWKQALRRRLIQYHIDDDTVSNLMGEHGLINLLTVVNPDEIISKTIPYIRSHFDEKNYKKQFDSFWDYFTRYWVEKTDPKDLNVYHLLSDPRSSYLINRTNNPLERFNKRLNEEFPTPHPTMVNFVETIKRMSLEDLRDMENIKKKRFTAPRKHKAPNFFQIPADY